MTRPVGYYETVNELLESIATRYQIPPDLLKAIAWTESDWQQFDDKGKPIIGKETSDIGIMQISPYWFRKKRKQQNKSEEEINEEIERLKKDLAHNIEVGAEWARDALRSARRYKNRGFIRNDEELMRGTYSAYNAGPDDTLRFQVPDEIAFEWEPDKRGLRFLDIYTNKRWNQAMNEELDKLGIDLP